MGTKKFKKNRSTIINLFLAKISQKSTFSWIFLSVLICILGISTFFIQSGIYNFGISNYSNLSIFEAILFVTQSLLRFDFALVIILLIAIHDAYQEHSLWENTILVLSKNRVYWLLSHILYLLCICLFITFWFLFFMTLLCILMINPSSAFLNIWTYPSQINAIFPEIYSSGILPLKALGLSIIYMFLYLFWMALLSFTLRLTETKFPFGIFIPIGIAILQWRIRSIELPILLLPIWPIENSLLYNFRMGAMLDVGSRVGFGFSNIYWFASIIIFLFLTAIVVSRKDFCTTGGTNV